MTSRKNSELVTLTVMMLAVFMLMWYLNGSAFVQVDTLQSMAFQLPELGILSLAMMITMLTGGINLSIIAAANLSGVITAEILVHYVAPDATGAGPVLIIALAIAAGLLVSAVVGLLNGFLIAVVEVSPILATLGTMILVKGVSIVITRGYTLSGLPEPVLYIGNGLLGGVPMPMILFLLSAGVLALILNWTRLGQYIYMIGSNPVACLYAGVNNARVLVFTYLISGVYAGIAAMIMIARFNSAKADYGEAYLLLTVLASVLGGVSAAGGFGRVSGVVIALIILQLVSSGLNLMGVNTFLTIAMWGAILIGVMVINSLNERYQFLARFPLPRSRESVSA